MTINIRELLPEIINEIHKERLLTVDSNFSGALQLIKNEFQRLYLEQAPPVKQRELINLVLGYITFDAMTHMKKNLPSFIQDNLGPSDPDFKNAKNYGEFIVNAIAADVADKKNTVIPALFDVVNFLYPKTTDKHNKLNMLLGYCQEYSDDLEVSEAIGFVVYNNNKKWFFSDTDLMIIGGFSAVLGIGLFCLAILVIPIPPLALVMGFAGAAGFFCGSPLFLAGAMGKCTDDSKDGCLLIY